VRVHIVGDDPEQSRDELVRFREETEEPEGGKGGEPVTIPEPFCLVPDAGGFPVERRPPHPRRAATTTSTGTDRSVDSRIDSRASDSPTR